MIIVTQASESLERAKNFSSEAGFKLIWERREPMSKRQEKLRRFKTRRKYVRAMAVLIVAWILIMLSPLYLQQRVQKVDQVFSQPFIESRALKMVNRYKQGKNNLILEFAVDNEDRVLTKDLVNLNYKIEVKTARGEYQDIKQEFEKVTESFFILKLENMPETYDLLKVTINGNPINQVIDTQTQKDMIYYLHQDKVKNEVGKIDYRKEAANHEIDNLKDQIEKQNKEVEKYKANIHLNEKLVEKINEEMEFQTDEEKEESKITIDNYRIENETSESKVAAAEEKIEKLKEKISLKKEQFKE